jgi:hypothetical protein
MRTGQLLGISFEIGIDEAARALRVALDLD